MREARYYQQRPSAVQCQLCPKNCVITDGKTGFCRVRQNIGGKLLALNYGACTGCALDPIEKKPLYHFYPGSDILSLGTWGCNFACQFCQNWQIAQQSPETKGILPEQAVALALAQGKRNVGIAYTYSEPSVWYEYVLDTAAQVKKVGLKNVLVTNGFINPEPLKELLPYIDAMNIDVKAFNEDFYSKMCFGRLETVKQTVEIAAEHCHVEITTLLVPDMNDDQQEIVRLSQWLADVNPNIPLHLSRYFPNYKLSAAATPLATMESAYYIARDYLHYVYLGNVGNQGVNTHCPRCGLLVINRDKRSSVLHGDNKACPQCGLCIPIVGEVMF